MCPFGILPAPGTCTITGYREPKTEAAEPQPVGEQSGHEARATRGWGAPSGEQERPGESGNMELPFKLLANPSLASGEITLHSQEGRERDKCPQREGYPSGVGSWRSQGSKVNSGQISSSTPIHNNTRLPPGSACSRGAPFPAAPTPTGTWRSKRSPPLRGVQAPGKRDNSLG